jgi:hypothetical protein
VNGDFFVVIQVMCKVTKSLPGQRIEQEVVLFHKIKFLQVLREQNVKFDQFANETTRERKIRVLRLNGSRYY